ncbi:MAG: heavy metal translocating P-type ATPase [Christensenellales bacterium]
MTRKQKKNLIRIAISAVLFVAAYCVAELVEGIPWWGELLIFAAPYLIVGYDVLVGAAKNIVRGRVFDERFLMLIATVGAFAIGEYPEAVAVMLFYQVGELFQSIAVGRSRRSIAALMDIRPDTAVVLRDGQEITLSPDEVEKGERIIVRPGEKIPLDGRIVNGATTLNAAALTGESMPIDKSEGDEVKSGCINLSGVIEVETSSLFAESTVSKILALVENSAEKKAKSENFITKFAKYYTPAVVILAVLLAVIPPLVDGQWTEWVYRALGFLVVSCPCALVISVPLSFFGGIGGASRRGILIKGANYMELMSKPDSVIFDKTGTLTEGRFEVTAIHPEEVSERELLDIAALAESYSSHPIAESVIRAHEGDIDKNRITDVTERAGYGIEGVLDGKKIYVGNAALMESAGIGFHECHLTGTIIHVAAEGVYLGHIVVSDVVKPDAENAVKELKRLGVTRTVMLTGDGERVAAEIASAVGVDEVKSGLLPENKVEEAEKIISGNKTTVYVGDGINDAPVLMRADVGVAMGAIGSDAAIEAADVVIMDDKPSKVAEAVRISRKTMRLVYENIIFALTVKVAVLVLVALGIADMWLAVFADVGVSVIAVLNAMRALGPIKNK